MKSLFKGALVLAAAALIAGCSSSRQSTTARTAIEQALISQSAEFAMAKFADPNLEGKTFAFDDTQFEATDKGFALSALRLHLLKNGLKESPKADDAELSIRGRSAISAIDDSEFLIGFPSIPVIIPGAGTVSIPEIVLLGMKKQRGMSRMGMYAVTKSDGSLVHDFGTAADRTHYVRWRFLFIFSFRHTDLQEPYRKIAKASEE